MKTWKPITVAVGLSILSGCNLFGTTERPASIGRDASSPNGVANNVTLDGGADLDADMAEPPDMRGRPDRGVRDADPQMDMDCDCVIDTVCLTNGAPNPQNPCEQCDAMSSTNAWTAVAPGGPCDDGDGLTCTSGTCTAAGACESTLDDGSCLIDGSCLAQGETDPTNACNVCDPGVSTTAFATIGENGPCDLSACTTAVCLAGVCTLQAVDDGACYIGGVCYADTDPDPNNSCQSCVAAVDAANWSVLPDGSSCGQAASCECTAAVCLRNNGNPCD